MISDNRLQFDNKAFRKYYGDLGIKNRHSMPAYPQSNSKAKATNKTIINGLKKRLESTKGRWSEELPNVLWAYQATPRRSISKTHFSMNYGITKAVIPIKIGLLSMKTRSFSLNKNELLMAE